MISLDFYLLFSKLFFIYYTLFLIYFIYLKYSIKKRVLDFVMGFVCINNFVLYLNKNKILRCVIKGLVLFKTMLTFSNLFIFFTLFIFIKIILEKIDNKEGFYKTLTALKYIIFGS